MIAIPQHLRDADELASTAFTSWCASAALPAPHDTSPVTIHSALSRRTAHQSTDVAPLIAETCASSHRLGRARHSIPIEASTWAAA
jgi:hypothetical protein